MLKYVYIIAASGLGTSAIEYVVGYNAIDWLKDHILSLFGHFKSAAEAKVARLTDALKKAKAAL